MTESFPNNELADRLNLIESMISEGRCSMQRWSWNFLLWGVAYYVAIAWANWGRPSVAWPVTMVVAAAITGIVASRIRGDHPATTIGRALRGVWSTMGIVLFALMMSLAYSGHADAHGTIAVFAGMLAGANGASSVILRWKMQVACALVWLAVAIGACFVSDAQLTPLFLGAIFLCQILFGIYGMFLESRRRSSTGVAHA